MASAFSYISSILEDSKGNPSSKRWIALLCFIMYAVTWGASLFYGKALDPHIFDSLMYLIMGCLGITGLEKFAGSSE